MEKQTLFKAEHRARYNNYIKGEIRKFIIGYNKLDLFFTVGANPYEIDSLKFFSDLFKEMKPLLAEIRCFVDGNKLICKREKFNQSIDLFEKVLGLLKILDIRYLIIMTSPDPTEDPRWYKESEKTNEEIIRELIDLMSRISLLKPKKDEG